MATGQSNVIRSTTESPSTHVCQVGTNAIQHTNTQVGSLTTMAVHSLSSPCSVAQPLHVPVVEEIVLWLLTITLA